MLPPRIDIRKARLPACPCEDNTCRADCCCVFSFYHSFSPPFQIKKVRSRSCAPKNAEPRLLRHKFRINPKVCETEDAFLPKQKRNLTIDPDINLCRKTILPRDSCKNKCTMRNNCKSYNKRAGSTEPAQFFYLQKELPNRSVKVASVLLESCFLLN